MADHAIEVNSLSYTYEDGTRALDEVSFSIAQGQAVGLIGHNGSGKSTLLMNLIGILRGEGTISVCGTELSAATVTDIRTNVGYVFQDPRDQLFMSTVREDVAFGPLNMGLSDDEVHQRVHRALEAVGLGAFGDRTPYHLSGGEMRRAAIATVLSMSPAVLLLDEPSSGLDPRAKRELAGLFGDLVCPDGVGQCTTLVSSHDLAFIRQCVSRVIVLDHGRIAADGPTTSILDDHDLLEAHGL